jgi:hypothetical protein
LSPARRATEDSVQRAIATGPIRSEDGGRLSERRGRPLRLRRREVVVRRRPESRVSQSVARPGS